MGNNSKRVIPSMTGTFVDEGRLQLIDRLGAGGHGTVYRAVDTTIEEVKYFAVKILHRPEPGSRYDEMIYREVTLQSMVCDHPNILTIHKVCFDEKYVYIVLDLCSGGDLFSAILERRVYYKNNELIRQTFLQLIDAVHHCHEKGVFHRDIKPENILCSRRGSDVLLADFGLATTTRASKDTGCGSAFYMSPECIGRDLTFGLYSTQHSDIWSLGIILTNMISGCSPWRTATTEEVCFVNYFRDPDFLRKILPISMGANSILKRMLALNPLNRISLLELREAIMNIDTFFMTDEELRMAPKQVRSAFQAYSIPAPSPPSTHLNNYLETFDDNDIGSDSDSNFDFEVGGGKREEAFTISSLPGGESVDITLCAGSCTLLEMPPAPNPNSYQLEPLSNSSSSSSGDVGDGLITPETYPTYPAIEVPDFTEEENIGEIRKFPKIVDEAQKTKKKSFWDAFKRLKGLTLNHENQQKKSGAVVPSHRKIVPLSR